jgi:hypothetical protein
MEKQMSFAQRTALMRELAANLATAAETAAAEATRMEAAQERFATRGNKRTGFQTNKASR